MSWPTGRFSGGSPIQVVSVADDESVHGPPASRRPCTRKFSAHTPRMLPRRRRDTSGLPPESAKRLADAGPTGRRRDANGRCGGRDHCNRARVRRRPRPPLTWGSDRSQAHRPGQRPRETSLSAATLRCSLSNSPPRLDEHRRSWAHGQAADPTLGTSSYSPRVSDRLGSITGRTTLLNEADGLHRPPPLAAPWVMEVFSNT